MLNGLNDVMMFQLLINRFTFKELENDKKNIYVDRFVVLPLHIYRRHLSLPVWKMCPIPNLLLIAGKNIIVFSNKTIYVLILKNMHITESNFW